MAANLSDSYDKVVLGLALVLALGLGAIVYLNAGKVDTDFPDQTGGRRPLPEMAKEKEFEQTAARIGQAVELPQPKTEAGRPVNLFVGVPWFIRQGQEAPVDLGDESNAPVHPPIPNSWWLKYRIPPGFADSPQRDHDGDGFSNLEEFVAETDPTAFDSHPALIAKLRLAKLDKKQFVIEYNSDTAAGPLTPETTYKIRYKDLVGGRPRTINSDFIPAGQGAGSTFFSDGPAQLRFELKNVEQRVVHNARIGLDETVNFATIEDLSAAKKGDLHEIRKNTPKLMTDYTATLYLDAIRQAGNKVEVPERTRFALPFDPNAAEKPYLFKGVTEAGDVEIEFTRDGQTDRVFLTPEG